MPRDDIPGHRAMSAADILSGDRAMSAAILAGGRSTRMGTNKALLPFDGVRIIDGLLRKLRPLFPEVLVIANDRDVYADLGVPVFPDRIPEKGSLGGIYTAVFHSTFPQTFCIACDMPLANPAVIAYLRDRASGYDVVVPRTADGYQPLHAVYGKACLPHMEAMIRADRLKIDRLFPVVRVRTVAEEELRPLDPSLRGFINVNTREELETAARLTQEGG
ncbi:MAG: molybdenum cofactor guanylyltransferase [candidate division NC10 bacterium]|nr:molybdenum cofactor guanylyltransferase [candidate division NC10 bacterium]MBI2116843.1 molybdenum cofactor guanylyltransferase [candidate division NC10 bacterium]